MFTLPRALQLSRVQLSVLALALALRLPWISSRPLWLDEALQAWVSGAPDLSSLWQRLASQDLQPPGLALLLHLLPSSPLALRLPSLIAGLIAVALAWPVARAWRLPAAGTTLALLATTSPGWVFYAREARPTSGALCWVMSLLLSAGLQRHAPRPRHAVALCLTSLGALCWSYTLWALLPFIWLATVLPAGRASASAPDSGAQRIRSDSGVFVGVALCLLLGIALAHSLLTTQWAQRGNLSGGFLDPWLGLHGAATRPLAWLGYQVTGSAGRASLLLGAVSLPVTLLALRAASPALRTLMLAIPTFWVLSLLGLHPFGAVRHSLPLAPLLFLPLSAWLAQQRPAWRVGWLLITAAALLRAGPGLPMERMPTLLAELPHNADGVVIIDASAVMSVRTLAPDLTRIEAGWRETPQQVLSRTPAGEDLWVVVGIAGSLEPWEAALGPASEHIRHEGVAAARWIGPR